MTDGSSLNKSAFPRSNNCFCTKKGIVLVTLSAIEGPLIVNLEKRRLVFAFRKFREKLL